ncbi:MAG: ParB/RepB/Spo0J family partition protein [Clostridia bacterium]|nr:ParB/RepB/Spo0J family partition protein [Clostridia bacterium]
MAEAHGKVRRAERSMIRLRIRDIRDNPCQPRTVFDEEAIHELAESIRENGLISPVTVGRHPDGAYFLIAGERRIRALKTLGKSWVDAVVMEADEAESRALSLIENIQRQQLGFFEEANAMKELLRSSGMTQEALSKKLGKNPSTIANRLRLLRLPDEVQKEITKGKLTERHARSLLRLNGMTDKQLELAGLSVRKELNVKQLEQLVEKALSDNKKAKRQVKSIIRDGRMYVNAIQNAVKKLNETGANASCRVEETEKAVSVIVLIPKT